MLLANMLCRAPSSWAYTFMRDISNWALVIFQSKLFDDEDCSDGASGSSCKFQAHHIQVLVVVDDLPYGIRNASLGLGILLNSDED